MRRQDLRNRTPHFVFDNGQGFKPGADAAKRDGRIFWAFLAGMAWACILFTIGIALWPTK